MTLDGYSTAFRHGKAKTLYLSVPSKVAGDSTCPIKTGDTVRVRIEGKLLIFEWVQSAVTKSRLAKK